MFHTPKKAPSSISSRCRLAEPLFLRRLASLQKSRTQICWAWITYAFTTPDDKLAKLIDFEKRRLNSIIANKSIPPGTRASLWDSKSSHGRHVLELTCDIAE
jgi:hypothetical protein